MKVLRNQRDYIVAVLIFLVGVVIGVIGMIGMLKFGGK